MKRSNLSKAVGTGILCLGLSIAPVMSASAQTDTSGTDTRTDRTTVDTTTDYNRDNDFDWGWLGLLGLLGLAGLAGRKREEPARYREPEEVSRPGSSTRY